ncbi:Fe-S cluster assembly ATPase SufC [Thermogladius calderae]|uniref:Fe-S cluster assembly ATPase SufC n=1 Tax=Thermogladius calderae TaxID=1200300 RepID=UPI0030B82E5A
MLTLLLVENVSVEVGGKLVVRDVTVEVGDGEIVALMGPNGSGKTSLAYAVMGHPGYKVVKGKVVLNGEDITSLPPYERARRGLFLFFQNPVEVKGVSLRDLFNAINTSWRQIEKVDPLLEETAVKLGLKRELLDRGLNEGFSGGEKKRSEFLQALLLKPKCLLMDEPDSGLDLEGVRLLVDYMNSVVREGACVLLITHYPSLLQLVRPSRVLVMHNGVVVSSGGVELVDKIAREGYSSVVSQNGL